MHAFVFVVALSFREQALSVSTVGVGETTTGDDGMVGDNTGDDDGDWGIRVSGTIPRHISLVGGRNELVHIVCSIQLVNDDNRVKTVDGKLGR